MLAVNVRLTRVPMVSVFLRVPAVGFEPTTRCREQFLRLPRIPFRHAGVVYDVARNAYAV